MLGAARIPLVFTGKRADAEDAHHAPDWIQCEMHTLIKSEARCWPQTWSDPKAPLISENLIEF